MKSYLPITITALIALAALPSILGQSGRTPTGTRTMTINLIVNIPKAKHPAASAGEPADAPLVTKDALALFDSGIPQTIESINLDPTPAHVVLLIDTSLSFRLDSKVIGADAHKLLGELYGDDEAMVVTYAEGAEVVQPFTTDANKLRNATKEVTKKGMPRLFDALSATLDDALMQKLGSGKRVIIIISDGYDRGSTLKFDKVLARLQEENIVVYFIQVADRSFGVSRRDGPKAVDVVDQLTTGTGGKAYRIEEVDRAAKEISEEMRHGWYNLTYNPAGINITNMRRLLVTVYDHKFDARIKASQPAYSYN